VFYFFTCTCMYIISHSSVVFVFFSSPRFPFIIHRRFLLSLVPPIRVLSYAYCRYSPYRIRIQIKRSHPGGGIKQYQTMSRSSILNQLDLYIRKYIYYARQSVRSRHSQEPQHPPETQVNETSTRRQYRGGYARQMAIIPG
jgi:hypothetical protein